MFASTNTVYASCVSKLPSDGYAIVGVVLMYLMILMFAAFGCVQTFILFYKPRRHELDRASADSADDAKRLQAKRVALSTYAELAYLCIGLVTKTLLGLLLYIGSSV